MRVHGLHYRSRPTFAESVSSGLGAISQPISVQGEPHHEGAPSVAVADHPPDRCAAHVPVATTKVGSRVLDLRTASALAWLRRGSRAAGANSSKRGSRFG